ncbi:uncharacterized protein LOC116617845 [Nematostella vectensis]|uniref:uncharacterized protein LOC116617845 n=1 Tax=Nematostella vectensis TaxID=45351 RepID=UPI0020775B7B|nr:uncharacterized protein LOC116617845 [Nematostella vectensis]
MAPVKKMTIPRLELSAATVAVKLAVIHDGSRRDQWKHVVTSPNPADDASRGLSASEILRSDRWLTGPGFLWQGEDTWPKFPEGLKDLEDDDPEVRREEQVNATSAEEAPGLDEPIRRYSSWNSVKKDVAWLLR